MAEVFGTVSAAIGLAATVFRTAKGIRDTIHLVSLFAIIPEISRCSLVAGGAGDV